MAEWTIEQVADRFVDAAVTAHRLPPVRVAGFTCLWPEIARHAWEGYADERLILRLPASPVAIDRFVETTRWLHWLDEEQRHLVWARAQQRPWKPICKRLGCNRVSAWRRWRHALAVIVVRLNGDAPRIAVSQDRSVK